MTGMPREASILPRVVAVDPNTIGSALERFRNFLDLDLSQPEVCDTLVRIGL